MTYEVLTEQETLDACHDMSIARFGDGELRVANGGGCSSQGPDAKLAAELRAILETYRGCMVGIPNFQATPNKATWDKYGGPPFARFYRQETYGSAFITRPDNAPWIDNPEYWAAVRSIWRDQDVALVAGDMKSLTPALLTDARQVTRIEAPRQHAYSVIDDLEARLKDWPGLVLLCLGATATALAARLDGHGVHALDLGHIGMFMRHAGSYVARETLISPHYLEQNRKLHADPKGFGGDGKKHAERVLEYAHKVAATSILDYGCGEGTLAPALRLLRWKGGIFEYDPAMPGKELLPKPASLVACTDVLEHIEPELLDNVLRHLWNLTDRAAFFTIATRPANKVLPDGRNAHLTIETPAWWVAKLEALGWQVAERFDKLKDGKPRETWLWLTK